MNDKVNQKINFIWGITNDCLRGIFKPHEYKNVILPMVIIKRFADCGIYNNSKINFNDLIIDKKCVKKTFERFLSGFDDEIQDVIDCFNFKNTLDKLDKNNSLFLLVSKFCEENAYFGIDEISTDEIGYIFEYLIHKFSINFDATGEHFTSKDVVELLTDILLFDYDIEKINDITCYDMTMGTSQMLTTFERRVKELNSNVEVNCYGQEINKETYAIAKSDALIRGKNTNILKCGNTLTDDQLKDCKFDFILSNPPFGVDWKKDRNIIKKDERFNIGLPRVNDGQMLFLLNGLSKLKKHGKMAIIHSGSVLFTGDAGSGESEIRRYLIENDILESIIQLPKDLFYNTGINTYVLIITKNKPENKKGEVQLIDASKCFKKMRKSIGKKQNEITEEAKKLILDAYEEDRYIKNKKTFGEMEVKIKYVKNEEFGFYKITVEQPKRNDDGDIIYKKGNPEPDSELRDTETVPLTETIEEYMTREILPYASDAWVDQTKTKIGYEIPFTRHFYEYIAPRPSHDILTEIMVSEEKMMVVLKELLGHE